MLNLLLAMRLSANLGPGIARGSMRAHYGIGAVSNENGGRHHDRSEGEDGRAIRVPNGTSNRGRSPSGYLFVIIRDSASDGLRGRDGLLRERTSIGEIRFAANTLSYLGNVLQSLGPPWLVSRALRRLDRSAGREPVLWP